MRDAFHFLGLEFRVIDKIVDCIISVYMTASFLERLMMRRGESARVIDFACVIGEILMTFEKKNVRRYYFCDQRLEDAKI